MSKEIIAVVFGGKSGEHEVSVITAHQVMDALEVAGFEVLPIYINKAGSWYAGKNLHNLKVYAKAGFIPESIEDVYRVSLSPDPSIRELVLHPETKLGLFKKAPKLWADVFFPAIHGTFGEDGTIQGLFELANVPYVGPGVFASALAMDKVKTKELFRSLGLPVLDCVCFSRTEWTQSREETISKIESFEAYPVIVKPVTLGSTIGIKRCDNQVDLINAIEAGLVLDTRVLIEKALVDFYEINCSVLGLPARASVCEQPVSSSSILTFEDKYKRGGGKGGSKAGREGSKTSSIDSGSAGMANLQRIIPAPISEELNSYIQQLAIKAFEISLSSGVSRIDFLVEKPEERVYVNEMNNPPGSFAFYLWEASGLRFDQLVTELVNIAKRNFVEKNKTLYSFEANLLQTFV